MNRPDLLGSFAGDAAALLLRKKASDPHLVKEIVAEHVVRLDQKRDYGDRSATLGLFKRNPTMLAPELTVGSWSPTAALAQMRAMQREMDRMSQRLAAAEAKVRRLERPDVSR